MHGTCHRVHSRIPVLRFVIELLLAETYHLPGVVSDIINVSVHIQLGIATFQTDHIGKVIVAAFRFLLPPVSEDFYV